MKSSTFPSLRVTPELRADAESVLQEGETLSGFVETSIRFQIARRRAQQDFIARGIASRDESRASGEYYAADDVMRELDEFLVDAQERVPK